MPVVEIVIVIGAAALVLGYHVWFFLELRRHPERMVLGTIHDIRRRWVERIVGRGDALLAVQTLRNWTMGANFLASAAILIAIGLMGVLLSTEKTPELLHTLNLIGATDVTLVNVKLLLLVANFSLGFFSFSLTIRYFNHVGLIVGACEPENVARIAAVSLKYLNRGAWHYTLGMRAFYVAIPLALWLFGPIWLGIGAVAVTVALYIHDHGG